MKKLLLLLVLTGFAFSQNITTEYLYLDILSDLTANLPNRNPAALSSDNIPYSYAFSFQNYSDSGSYKQPFAPGGKHYNHLEVSAYRKMSNGVIFAGRFAYRYEQRKNKLWLHNAESNIDIPFYFADSTTGDFVLNGIDWNVLFSYPLSDQTRVGVDIFYNVDEQFKTVYPKPGIKRNDIHIRPAFYTQGRFASFGLTGSLFQFKENMKTVSYSENQDLTPIFIRIRGLDLPITSNSEISEERLQVIDGLGLSGHLDLGGYFSYNMDVKRANAQIVDGGSDPEEQGTWETTRQYHRFDLHIAPQKSVSANPFYEISLTNTKGYHPDLQSQIYQYNNRSYVGGISFTYMMPPESLTGTLSYGFQDINREDNFFGVSNYIPWNTLHAGIDYQIAIGSVDLLFNIGFDDIKVDTTIEYNDLSGWYYEMITANELKYYSHDRKVMEANLKIVFPFRDMKIAFIGTYKNIRPINTVKRYDMAQTKIEIMF